jgi:hypothetical protein
MPCTLYPNLQYTLNPEKKNSGHVPNDQDRYNSKDYSNGRCYTAPLEGAAGSGGRDSGGEWGGRGGRGEWGKRGGGNVFRVAYSLHSSFEQLESFLDFLRPVSVIGQSSSQ